MKITSTKVERGGAHEHVGVWIDGALAGTLVVGEGQGAQLVELLQQSKPDELLAAQQRKVGLEAMLADSERELAESKAEAERLRAQIDEVRRQRGTNAKPPIRLVSKRNGAIWSAREVLISAARDCASEWSARGTVDDRSCGTLVAALERYEAASAGAPLEDPDADPEEEA